MLKTKNTYKLISLILIVFSITSMLILCSAFYYKNKNVHNLPKLYKENVSSVVSLLVVETKTIAEKISFESYFYGSGFVVNKDKGWICTANHIFRNNRKVYLNKNDGRFILNIIIEDKNNDLVICKVDPKVLSQENREVIFNTELSIGEFIFAIGNPHRLSKSITFGILSNKVFSSLKDYNLYESFSGGIFLTDIMIQGGNSGCPVFNLNGEVVAMTSGLYDKMGILVPASSIINLMKEIK